jgi:hypothetical protein
MTRTYTSDINASSHSWLTTFSNDKHCLEGIVFNCSVSKKQLNGLKERMYMMNTGIIFYEVYVLVIWMGMCVRIRYTQCVLFTFTTCEVTYVVMKLSHCLTNFLISYTSDALSLNLCEHVIACALRYSVTCIHMFDSLKSSKQRLIKFWVMDNKSWEPYFCLLFVSLLFFLIFFVSFFCLFCFVSFVVFCCCCFVLMVFFGGGGVTS